MILSPTKPSSWLEQINKVANQGSELIDIHGWIQDQMTGENGELCIIAAGHEASMVVGAPGMSHVLREVLDHLGHAEEWNDTEGRKADEVINFLGQLKVTQDDLERTFGPGWEYVCYLANMVASYSEQEMAEWAVGQSDGNNYLLMRHMDNQLTPDPRELRARNAVCAAASERAEEFGMNPMGPSVAVMTIKVIRPTLLEQG